LPSKDGCLLQPGIAIVRVSSYSIDLLKAPLLDAVAEPAMVVKLWEHLLVRGMELNERENTLVARKDNVVAAERALGRA
jgi:hypothetical protein